MMKETELLEELRDRINCTYLSDLRFMPWKASAIQYLAGIEARRYTLWAWNDALEYLLNEKVQYSDVNLAQARFQAAARKLTAWGLWL